MRVLFSTSAWPGHYFPMIPLARHLARSGHGVRVLCAASQADAITAARLTAVPVLDGMDMVLQARLSNYRQAAAGRWPYAWLPAHPVTGRHLTSLAEFDFPAFRKERRDAILAATAASFDAAVAFARAWRPHLVVHDRLNLDGLLAARVLGIPAAVHLWGPVGTAEAGTLRLIPGDPTGSFPRYGVGELADAPFSHVIDPCPASLAPPVGSAHRLDARYVPYAGERLIALPPPAAGRPRVCVVWGTSLTAMVGPRSFVVPDILAALSGTGLDVVALLSADDSADLVAPPDIQVTSEVALARALSGAAVVVHHGGAGCAMTAIAAGVPQVAITFAEEQAANAERIAATGAGAHIPGHEFTPARLRQVVEEAVATTSSRRPAAARLRAQHETRPDLASQADRLSALAGMFVHS